MVLFICDSPLPMGMHHCIEKCAVGLGHHKAYKDHLITCTNLQLEAAVVLRQVGLLDGFFIQLCHFTISLADARDLLL